MRTAIPEPGAVVWIRQRRWRIERARRVGDIVCLDVVDRERRLTFLAPFDRPSSPERRPRGLGWRRQGARARLAGLMARRDSARVPLSAVDADVDLVAHQLEPVLAVLAGARRVLIADDVGLGKTIQAGLVAAELVRRWPAARGLLIVPAALRTQWRDEMQRRFKLACRSADRASLACTGRAGRFGDNPWQQPGLWIGSPDFLRQPGVVDGMPFTPWDLVIVDEAHDACGDTERHAAVDEIARRARVVVALTATPHSGDQSRFARLERIGALDEPLDTLTVFRRTRQDVGLEGSRHVHWQRVSQSREEVRVFDALLAFERAVFRGAGNARRGAAELLLSVFRKRALSSLHALRVSVERRLAWIDRTHAYQALDWVQPSLSFQEDGSGEDRGDDECDGLTADVGVSGDQERTWLRRLIALLRTAEPRDGKIRRVEWMATRSLEPLVVFTEFRHSLVAAAARLRRVRSVSVLHGGLTRAESDAALADFLAGRTAVLVATDVAGQGLNLQARARRVVSLEVPWNPARLEQRIGRVDRIGQRRRVHATMLLADHPCESIVLRRLAARAIDARRSVAGDPFSSIVPPAERLVARAALLGREDLPSESVAAAADCRAWTRTARAVVRHVAGRRALAARWRTQAAPSTRYGIVRAFDSPPVPPGDVRLVVAAPFCDAAGTVVERVFFIVHAEGGAPDADRLAASIERMPLERVAALRARVARLGRLARVSTERRMTFERAIARRLHAIQCPEESQIGLFDPAYRERERSAAEERARTAEHSAARVRLFEAEATLAIGRPRVMFLIGLRP